MTTVHEPWLLLVEDSSSDRELTTLALSAGDTRHRVEAARDGVEALDVLQCRGRWQHRDRTDHPRVILLDVNMPLVNGFEVLREIRADDALRDVPVVMLTSSAEERDLAESYALGANSYVVKPVDIDEFFETVGRVGTYWLAVNRSGQETSS